MDTRRAMAALSSVLPDTAHLAGVDFEEVEGHHIVSLRTATPGILVGRMGQTADRIRAALVGALGHDVRLNILELRQPVS